MDIRSCSIGKLSPLDTFAVYDIDNGCGIYDYGAVSRDDSDDPELSGTDCEDRLMTE